MEFDNKMIWEKGVYKTLNDSIERLVDVVDENMTDILDYVHDAVDDYKSEIQRLEDRVRYLEEILSDNGIKFD